MSEKLKCDFLPCHNRSPNETLLKRIEELSDELAKAHEENGRLGEWIENADHTELCKQASEFQPSGRCCCGLDELKAQLSILRK